ncbi:putative virion structural protein [Pseudomonas phage OBP]|uniref:virion structural protein n=1 Tax=Pseudomonas phage OBP TaxID=1124849 RepID=UPI000240D563|nr:virion structural protein [Pseudomonas phage OBP]AEV89579.1 putative virion structural protein [Pseudomonas phage OBP]
MPNDSRLKVSGKMTYPWNPFQDVPGGHVDPEPAHVQGGSDGVIIVPRAGPFFSRDFKIKLADSGRELKMEAGEYGFLFPFGAFIQKYNRLAYGALHVKGVTGPTDFIIEYDTIGGDFVLDDIAYAQAVANTLTAPRTIDWSQLTNLPSVWPSDPHEQPASDTMNYGDLIVWMKSYLDAITATDMNFNFKTAFEAHVKEGLQKAHKGKLEDLGINNLKDWPMATDDDIQGDSTEIIVNMHVLKEAIRGFARGDWR